ncbi:MAG: hypothetical protein IH587_08195 [Anaerolineae bacterium]|nr:hypothetical protein [Anaerolineae bacterium]
MAQSSPPQRDNVQVRYVPSSAPQKRSPLRRPGCIAALLIWFALLILIPVAFFTILTRGEITVSTGDVPDQQARLWLISNADERGFGYSNAWAASRSDVALCLQTDVRYWLWQGSAESVTFCDCYERVDTTADWSFTGGSGGACPSPAVGE